MWRRKPQEAPEWAIRLEASVLELTKLVRTLTGKEDKIMSEDAAIEAEVTELNADQQALAAAFATLQQEVANGGTPSDQAMTDLQNAVAGITGTIPQAPTPPAGP